MGRRARDGAQSDRLDRLQYLKGQHGGFLGKDFRSKAGLPVINVPGCPAHPDWVTQVLVAVASGRLSDIALDDLQRPATFFKTFTQTGCTRHQYFEFKQSVKEFGQARARAVCFTSKGAADRSRIRRATGSSGTVSPAKREPECRASAVRNRSSASRSRRRHGVQDAARVRRRPEGAAARHRSDQLLGPSGARSCGRAEWVQEDMFVV